jgi:hypothetical protein
MVASPRAPVRVDRLRSLNIPSPVSVTLDGHGRPSAVTVRDDQARSETIGDGQGWSVEAVGEIWRVDDEWWRQPIVRRYVEAIFKGGKHVLLFEDLCTGQWFLQHI